MNFTDIAGHWAEDEITAAALRGWVLGDDTGAFRPNAAINRSEIMAIVNRALHRLPETEEDLLDGMTEWSDNQPGTWYYLTVQEKTNSHDYGRKANGYEQWTALLPNPTWE